MKKTALILFMAAALLLLSACGKQTGPEPTVPGPTASEAVTAAPSAVKAEPSETVKALNERAERYLTEMSASGKVTKETNADWYTIGSGSFITAYIPSFLRTDMSLFEIQKGELVYVGPAVADPENLCVQTAKPLSGGLALAEHPEFYEAVLAMADAYFFQGPQLNYDMTNKRQNLNGLPNDATADRTMYLDCSSYASTVYYNALVTAEGGSKGVAGSAATKTYMAEICGGYADEKRPQYVAYFKRSSKNADSWEGGVGSRALSLSGTEVLQALMDSLQPGDILVTRKGTATPENGHAMLYVGNGYILHSTGTSIGASVTPETVMGYTTLYSDNSSASADEPVTGEMANGTIYKTHWKYLFDRSTLVKESGNPGINRRYLLYDGTMLGGGQDAASSKTWEIGVLRPLMSGNYAGLSEEGRAALTYPGVTVEKRILKNGVSIYDRTVLPGDTLTLEITLENHGSAAFASIEVNDGEVLRETVSLAPAGQEECRRVLTAEFTVPLDAAPGNVVSPRATAGGISSNEVSYVVGHSTEEARKAALEPVLGLDLSGYATNLQAAKALYAAAFGKELLKDWNEVSLVQIKLHKNGNYIFGEELPVVGTLQGGYTLHASSDGKHQGLDYIRRVRPEYLEAGDLIVVASGASTRLMLKDLYLFWDENTVYRFTERTGAVTLEPLYTEGKKVTSFLTSLYCTKGFMVLRPDMAE